jgi:hypothetical protein
MIDSAYIRQESIFQGDTILFPDSRYCFAIISYDDRLVCSNKFLVVFDRSQQKGTDYKMIYTDCDRPEGESYNEISYEIPNDSSLIIIYNQHQKASDGQLKLTVEKERWRLGETGIFSLLAF